MNYASIKFPDIANGPGCRVSLFVSGCRLHCRGCQNQCIWDFNSGKKFGTEDMLRIINVLRNPYTSGLSILGGEPMEPENAAYVLDICELAKREYPDKDIWIYTGHWYEDLIKKYPKLSFYADVMVDGPWIEELGDRNLRFRGSSNQRIIDLAKSEKAGKAVLWVDPNEQDPKMNMADRAKYNN